MTTISLTTGLLAVSLDGSTGFLRFERPEKRNAINTAMADDFERAVSQFEAEGVTTVILRGRGSVFCGGNDLGDLGPGDVASAPATRVIEAMTHSDLFWVTVIEGPAIGAGAQIAAVSQVALGTPEARIELPEARMGLFPSVIFDQLSRTMGRRAAFTACMTGVSLSSNEARRLGLLTGVAGTEDLSDLVDRWLEVLSDTALARAAAKSWRRHFDAADETAREAVLNGLLEDQFSAFVERRRAHVENEGASA